MHHKKKGECLFSCFVLQEGGESVVAYFEYHKHPITSIEWSPHHEAASTIVVSLSDNQLT